MANLIFRKSTTSTGLTATLSTGTNVVTVTSTANLSIGQILVKTSGTGSFGTNATIASITNSTQFLASVNHSVAGSITFDVTSVPSSTSIKNAALLNAEIDGNFKSLDDSKFDKTGGTISGNVTVTGELSAANLNSTSDERYKADIEKIQGALDKVKQLTGYTFTMIETGQRSSGLLAQEVNDVLPEVVGGTSDKLSLAYGNMLGLIVEAIKELDNKIKALKI